MTSEFNVPEKMTCEEFQDHLPELIATGEDISQHPHILECELCRSLLADLQAIADAARDLLRPAEEDPPDRIWQQIQSKIEAEGPESGEEEPEIRAADPVKQK
jgi:hypothetical protein